mmetsp:Transcript_18903/g.58227  ORF Transcript_18903/g.58227 Transcript_18903/m.58227 type:complete len:271 (-) Transcript_18903:123-935(-)
MGRRWTVVGRESRPTRQNREQAANGAVLIIHDYCYRGQSSVSFCSWLLLCLAGLAVLALLLCCRDLTNAAAPTTPQRSTAPTQTRTAIRTVDDDEEEDDFFEDDDERGAEPGPGLPVGLAVGGAAVVVGSAQVTPTSSEWAQSCSSQPAEQQLLRAVSEPEHVTSSSQMGDAAAPAPNPAQQDVSMASVPKSWRHTTAASCTPKESSQTLPQTPSWKTSSRPAYSVAPSTKRIGATSEREFVGACVAASVPETKSATKDSEKAATSAYTP